MQKKYKISYTNNNEIKQIYVFYGDCEYDLDDLFLTNPNDELIKGIFSPEEMSVIKTQNIPVKFCEDQIHIDDTIETIKKKIINEFNYKISFEELYLFNKQTETLDTATIYQTLTQNNKLELTRERLVQYLLNIDDIDVSSIQDKEIYDYDDILSLNLDQKQFIVSKALGQKFVAIEHTYPYTINPFNAIVYDTVLEKSAQDIITTLNNSLLMSNGDILNNMIYVCVANDVFKYANEHKLNELTTIKIYYPFLLENDIQSAKEYKFKREELIKNSKELLSPAFIKNNEQVNLFYDVYENRNKELNYKSIGIKSIEMTIHPSLTFNLPLDMLFKLIHATVDIPLIKYNPGKRQEKIYRLYCDRVATNGKKIPYLTKGTIFKVIKQIGNIKSVATYIEKEYKGGDKMQIICEFIENGDINIVIVSGKKHMSINEIEDIIKESVNPIINILKSFAEQSGYTIHLFNDFSNKNIEIIDIVYENIIQINKNVNINSIISCASSIFNVTEHDLSKGIVMRFKRVSNYNEMDSQDSLIVDLINKSRNENEILQALVDNYNMSINAARMKYANLLSQIQVMKNLYPNKKYKIKNSPGFLTTIVKDKFSGSITISMNGINDIHYLNVIQVYFDTFVRLTQDITTTNVSDKTIEKLCKGKSLKEEKTKIIDIVAPSEKPFQDNKTLKMVGQEFKYKDENEIGNDDDDILDIIMGEDDYEDEEEDENDEEDNSLTHGGSNSSSSGYDSSELVLSSFGSLDEEETNKSKTPNSSSSNVSQTLPSNLLSVSSLNSRSLSSKSSSDKGSSFSSSSSASSLKSLSSLQSKSISSPRETLSDIQEKTIEPSIGSLSSIKTKKSISSKSSQEAEDTSSSETSEEETSSSSSEEASESESSSSSSSEEETSSSSSEEDSESETSSSSSEEETSSSEEDSETEMSSSSSEDETSSSSSEEDSETESSSSESDLDSLGSISSVKSLSKSIKQPSPQKIKKIETTEKKPIPISVQKTVIKEDIKDITGMNLTRPNPFFKKLQDKDPKLFLVNDVGQYNAYSRSCPANDKRQPVILTDEEKLKIDKEHPGSYEQAIKYGSDPNNKYWYICPRYWSLTENTSLTEEEVKSGKYGSVIPMDAKKVPKGATIYEFNDKKMHKGKNNEYIHFSPGFLDDESHPDGLCVPCCYKNWNSAQQVGRRDVCKRKQDIQEAKIGITKKAESDVSSSTSSSDGSSASKVTLTDDEVSSISTVPKATGAVESVKEKRPLVATDEYIKGPDKFPLELNRWGYLPLAVQKFFRTDNNKCYISSTNTNLKKHHACMLRRGVENNMNQSFVACIADALMDEEQTDNFISIVKMKERIIQSLTLDNFIVYQNGNLVKIFENEDADVNIDKYKTTNLYKRINKDNLIETGFLRRVVSAYENFIEYLKTDNLIIDHRYLWDIVSIPNEKLFSKGLNLIILEIPDNDITDNVNILCPTNHFSNEFFDINKKCLILLKIGGFYEPINTLEDKEKLWEINRLFSLKNKSLMPNLRDTLDIIKTSFNNKCLPLPSMPTVYKFKTNIKLQDLIKILKPIGYVVNEQIMNFNGKIIGIIATNSTKKTSAFVPCYPSASIPNMPFKLMDDDGIWRDFQSTIDFLLELSKNSKNKIPCLPKIKVIEDGLIVGLLTETNQFIATRTPEQNMVALEMEEVTGHNYILSDTLAETNHEEDNERIKYIKRIKLETNFYNVFRNTIRILLGQFRNRAIREELEQIIKNPYLLYINKLKQINNKLKTLTNKYISFKNYTDNEILNINEITNCMSSNNCDDKTCSMDENKICKLIFN